MLVSQPHLIPHSSSSLSLSHSHSQQQQQQQQQLQAHRPLLSTEDSFHALISGRAIASAPNCPSSFQAHVTPAALKSCLEVVPHSLAWSATATSTTTRLASQYSSTLTSSSSSFHPSSDALGGFGSTGSKGLQPKFMSPIRLRANAHRSTLEETLEQRRNL